MSEDNNKPQDDHENDPNTAEVEAPKANQEPSDKPAPEPSNEPVTAAMDPVPDPIVEKNPHASSPENAAPAKFEPAKADAEAEEEPTEKKSPFAGLKNAAAKVSEKAATQANKLRKPPSEKNATEAESAVAAGTLGAGTAAVASTVMGNPEPAETNPAAAAGKTATKQRRVKLTLSRIDIGSTLKLSFLMSVAIGIMTVIAAMIAWGALDSLAVFTEINDLIVQITDDPDWFPVLEYFAFSRVVSFAMLIAVVNVVLLTALATVIALVYNAIAALVGGVRFTMTDE